MSDLPPDSSAENDPHGDESLQPASGQVQSNPLSARVPAEVGAGTFSNGVIILSGAHEFVIDFCLRMGGQHRIVSRVVLSHVVAKQFCGALQENVRNYERRFGPIPPPPQPIRHDDPELAQNMGSEHGPASHPENQPSTQSPPHVEDIYHELKLSDNMLSGRYANAVLIRHSPTEFCFDFITNIFPQSAVSSRVYLASPHVIPLLKSLIRSLQPPPPPGSADETVFGA